MTETVIDLAQERHRRQRKTTITTATARSTPELHEWPKRVWCEVGIASIRGGQRVVSKMITKSDFELGEMDKQGDVAVLYHEYWLWRFSNTLAACAKDDLPPTATKDDQGNDD